VVTEAASANNLGQSKRPPLRGFPNTEENVREAVRVRGEQEGRLKGGRWRSGEVSVERANLLRIGMAYGK